MLFNVYSKCRIFICGREKSTLMYVLVKHTFKLHILNVVIIHITRFLSGWLYDQ